MSSHEEPQESEGGIRSDATGYSIGQASRGFGNASVNNTSKLCGSRRCNDPNVAMADGLKVRPLWLEVSSQERYLMLEDMDTGDVLLPLIYMKSMFEANYSRKLASLKHRLVALPDDLIGERPRGFVYWKWAFESPHEVKVLVRKMLGEENTPQGHLRLVLLPIVFNAMSLKPNLKESTFYKELESAVRSSTYWSLLNNSIIDNSQDDVTVGTPTTSRSWLTDTVSDPPEGKLEPWTEVSGQTLKILAEDHKLDEKKGKKCVFHGPFDLHKTIAKYCMTYEAVEAVEVRKAHKPEQAGLPVFSHSVENSFLPPISLQALQKQGEQIKADLTRLKQDTDQQMLSIHSQLGEIKDILLTLVDRTATSMRSQLQQGPPQGIMEQKLGNGCQCLTADCSCSVQLRLSLHSGDHYGDDQGKKRPFSSLGPDLCLGPSNSTSGLIESMRPPSEVKRVEFSNIDEHWSATNQLNLGRQPAGQASLGRPGDMPQWAVRGNSSGSHVPPFMSDVQDGGRGSIVLHNQPNSTHVLQNLFGMHLNRDGS